LPKAPPTPEAAAARRQAQRQRMELSQRIAGEVARNRAAGAPPGEAESARLIAEYHARGGQVQQCEPGDGIRLPEEAARKG
jgi:hypothetical protein